MNDNMIYLSTTGFFTVKKIDWSKDLNRQLHDQLHGFYEIVRPHPQTLHGPYLMLCDDEGVLKELDMNPVASLLYGGYSDGGYIAGPVLILKEEWDEEDGPDITGLTEDDVSAVISQIREATASC